VTDLPDGVATVRNVGTGQGLELRWDAAVLPHVWIWHEVRTYPGIWRGCAEILAVEPASVPHGLGLETALREGQALVATPHAPVRWRIAVRPLP
jgi:hypothetical protein